MLLLPSVPGVNDREQRYRDLFDSCYQPLHAFARRRLPPADADDLVADVLTTAWRRLDDIPPHATLPWLFGVAHRTLANQRRGRDRRRRLLQRLSHVRHEAAPAGSPAVVDALTRLNDKDQEILRLAAWEGLAARDIAVVLGCTPNAAALRLSRARGRLRSELARPRPASAHQQGMVDDV